jgi:hypothetical protein
MEHLGTSLARSPRMNDRPLSPPPSNLALPRSPEPPRPPVEEPCSRRDEADETPSLDKYDLSTLACTD